MILTCTVPHKSGLFLQRHPQSTLPIMVGFHIPLLWSGSDRHPGATDMALRWSARRVNTYLQRHKLQV